MGLAVQAAEIGNVNAISDAGVAANLSKTAITGAGLNVRINLIGLEKESEPARMLNELKNLEKHAEEHLTALQKILVERGGLSF